MADVSSPDIEEAYQTVRNGKKPRHGRPLRPGSAKGRVTDVPKPRRQVRD